MIIGDKTSRFTGIQVSIPSIDVLSGLVKNYQKQLMSSIGALIEKTRGVTSNPAGEQHGVSNGIPFVFGYKKDLSGKIHSARMLPIDEKKFYPEDINSYYYRIFNNKQLMRK